MFLPVGVEDARIPRWPVVTFTIAVLTLAVSASVVWHTHLLESGPWFVQVDAYHLAHPDLDDSGACQAHLTPVPAEARQVQGRAPGDPKKFASLCAEAIEAQAKSPPLWLVRPGRGVVQLGTLAGGLAFPDVSSAIIGVLLLVLVFGSFLENAWGRDRFLAFWFLASVVATVAYQRSAPADATDVLATGPALSAACMAAFAGTLGKRKLQFAYLTVGGKRHLALPGWMVVAAWLFLRLTARMLARKNVPGAVEAELAGLGIGAVTAMIARAQQWYPAGDQEPTPEVTPEWATQMSSPLGARGAEHAPAPADPQPAEAGLLFGAPSPQASAAPPLISPSELGMFSQGFSLDPPPPRTALEIPAAVPVEADSGWARFTSDEPALVPGRGGRASAPAIPVASAAPLPDPFAAAAAEPLFVASTPATHAAVPAEPWGAVSGDAFSSDTFNSWSIPAASEVPEVAPQVRPQLAATVPTPAADSSPGMAIERWQLIGRDASGLSFRDIHGQLARLPPERLLAVTAGIVKSGEPGTAGPALLLDVVLDERPRRCIRLRPSPEALAHLWPTYSRGDAVAALARELSSGRALRLPQTPEWPGPPWAMFADVGALEAVSLMGSGKRRG